MVEWSVFPIIVVMKSTSCSVDSSKAEFQRQQMFRLGVRLRALGNQDGPQPTGVFSYTGEGQVGDMRFHKGNLAIRDHLKHGKDLLLFQSQSHKGRYSFLGCYACAGWHHQMTPERKSQYVPQ